MKFYCYSKKQISRQKHRVFDLWVYRCWSSLDVLSLILAGPTITVPRQAGLPCRFLVESTLPIPIHCHVYGWFSPSVLRTVFFAKYTMSFHFKVWGCCTSLGLKLLYLAGSMVAVPYRVHIRCSSSVLRSLYLTGSAVTEPRRVYGWWPPSVTVPQWVYGWWSSLVAVPRRVYGW